MGFEDGVEQSLTAALPSIKRQVQADIDAELDEFS
jgi:hypothetical protein